MTAVPRWLRYGALAVIALSQIFLVIHSQEPLRLNIGDPWSDANVLTSLPYVKEYGFLETSFTDILDVGPLTDESYRYIHYPPLAEITYGAAHKFLGVDSIGTFRLFAIGFSALALWCLFSYVRRLYDDTIGLIAVTLWSSNLLWLMYADSIHQAPIMQASAFFGLWGLLRALEQPLRRYWAAAWVGCFACFLTSYDYWLFLPSAVLFTVYVRRGNPLRLANIRPVLLCASACFAAIVVKSLFVIGAVGWNEFVADLHFQFLERSTNTFERGLSATPSLVRRANLMFSPLIWVVVGWHVVRGVRAASLTELLRDTAAWLLATALLFFVVFSQLAASQALAMQVALPFFAIGTGMLVARYLRGGRVARGLAIALLVVPPIWTVAMLQRHERSLLHDEDVARVNAHLREHDRNDFLVSNLLQDGAVQAYFGRHYFPAPWGDNYGTSHVWALATMTASGRDHFHVLVFKNPASRMIDKSLWPLAAPKRQWSVTGWPLIWRKKSEGMIRDYDERVVGNLLAVNARVVASSSEIDLYQVTRAAVEQKVRAGLDDRHYLDFGSYTTVHNLLGGWGAHLWLKDELVAGWEVAGQDVCPQPGSKTCRTVLTKRGVVNRGQEFRPEAEFMMRIAGGCDVELTLELARTFTIDARLNGADPISVRREGSRYVARFTSDRVVDGPNVIALRYPLADRSPAGRAKVKVPVLTSAELQRTCPAPAPAAVAPPPP